MSRFPVISDTVPSEECILGWWAAYAGARRSARWSSGRNASGASDLGGQVGCVNQNNPDGSLTWELVAMRGEENIIVSGPDVYKVWWEACRQVAKVEREG